MIISPLSDTGPGNTTLPQTMPVSHILNLRRLPPRKIEYGIEAAEGRVIVDPALHVHAYRSSATSSG
jgi:hypothetical protein